jgi:predicted Zn-dependent protease
MKCKQILSVLLFLILIFALSEFSQAQAQVNHSLELQQITWNHSTISVLIIPQENESWWNPSHLNATLRAICEWNQAIQDFTSNYTDYAYLSKLRMTPTVAYTMDSGFDVYVFWSETPSRVADEVGYTKTFYNVDSRSIKNSTINLASKLLQGLYSLNEIEMQNVVLHELGHSLGLGHSNFTEDLMYPIFSMNPLNRVQALSTLDLYGVSAVFQWMSNSSNSLYSSHESSVTLPSKVAYRYLPIFNADLPTSSAYSVLCQTLLTYIQYRVNNVTSLVMRPEVSTILIVIFVLLVIVFLFARQQKAKKTEKRTIHI